MEEPPVVDSALTEREIFAGLDPRCPAEVRRRQALVDVTYWSFDGRLHRGQLVLDRALVDDVRAVFEIARRLRFPIGSAIPLADRRFWRGGRWSDDLSMAANNTSAFQYRTIAGSRVLSRHALGRALDINPLQNPVVGRRSVAPPGARHDPRAPGTLTADHPIVRELRRRGWQWGGRWRNPRDFQHFEKPVKR